MTKLEKVLLLSTAGLLAYRLIRPRTTPNLEQYYRNKVAVVTGGASGIGQAIALQLHRLGSNVMVVDRNAQALQALREAEPTIATLALDLAEEDAPQRMLDATCARFGRMDILFNNAGIVYVKPFLEMTSAEIERLIKVNFMMQIRITHTLLPYMLQRGSGVIAYTGSLSAHVYAPMHSVYTGTKGGLHNFVAAVRRELPINSGVQFTIIQPNITRTNLVEASLFDALEKEMDLQTPDEVATAMLKGIARGDKEVFVRIADHLYKWAERLMPEYLEGEFRRYAELDPRNKPLAKASAQTTS